MCYLAFVQSALVSALTAFIVPKHFTDNMDKMVAKHLRALLKGKAHLVSQTGQHRTWTNDQLFAKWKIAKTATELRVRRLRMYQAWARHPDDFK